MKINSIKRKVFCFLILLFGYQINIFSYAFAPTNFYRPYDVNLRMTEWKGAKFSFGANFEYGNTGKCRDWNENKVNVLRIYSDTESSIAMLLGATRGSEIYNLANSLLPAYAPATDDGYRGRFKLDGNYEGADLTFWGKYRLPIKTIPGTFDLYLFFPFKYMEIGNVKWNDQTKSVLSADKDVHSYLTDDISSIVKTYGNLDIDSWKKTGISDITLMLYWYADFKQIKEHLKNVRLNINMCLTAPSGAEKDEDKTFSLPLGNDGAWGYSASFGLDLFFVNKAKAGLNFEMFFLFSETRERRLKTDENQTDFLLLHKGRATKNFGFTWKFNLFVQIQRFLKGLSGMIAYQFARHDGDKLTAESNDFNYHIINSAQSLQEWSMQNFIFQLNYDFFEECNNSWFKPQLSFFYKMPVTGKRVINPSTFGGQIALSF